MIGRKYKDNEFTSLRKLYKDLNIEQKYEAWLSEVFFSRGDMEHDIISCTEAGENEVDYLLINYEARKIKTLYTMRKNHSIKNIDIPQNWYKNLLHNDYASDLIAIYSLAQILKSANIEGVKAMQNLSRIQIHIQTDFLSDILGFSLTGVEKAIKKLIFKNIIKKVSKGCFEINPLAIKEITNNTYYKLEESGYLYLASDPKTNLLKIGRTTNLVRRLAAIRRDTKSQNTFFLYKIKGKGYIEKKIHEIFIKYHVKNEWFEDVPEIRKFFKNFK